MLLQGWVEAVFTVDRLLPCLRAKRPTSFYSDATFGWPLAAETPQLPGRVSSPRPETCGKIPTHNVVMSLYICMVCKGTIFALSVGIIFVRGPELAVSAEQCVHWEGGRWKAKIGAISRLTGSSLCGFWNSSPVCSLSLLSVGIHGALCVQGYTREGNTWAFFFLWILAGDWNKKINELVFGWMSYTHWMLKILSEASTC